MHLRITDIEDSLLREAVFLIAAVLRPYFRQFSVKMEDIGTARPLMKIIHILRYHIDIEIILKRSDGTVCVIGSYPFELMPPYIIEVEHQARILVPALDGRDLLRVVIVPQTAIVTERADSALGAHTGACQNYKLFHFPSLKKQY